jgi:hypothetical protein
MDQITQLKIEYFELCRLLNKSNLKVNQKTDVSFFIEKGSETVILFATANKTYKMQLVYLGSNQLWTPCNYSGLAILEDEISKQLNRRKAVDLKFLNLTNLIKSFIFKKFEEH